MPESPDVEETSKNLPWKCDLADLVKVPDGLDGTFGSKRYRKQGGTLFRTDKHKQK